MSEICSIWRGIVERPDFIGYEFRECPAPRTNPDSIIKFRNICKENKCGMYGTTWGCPPGSCTDDEILNLINGYSRVILYSRRYDNVDFSDMSGFADIQKEFQNISRTLSRIAASEGIDNLPLAEGGCTYCGKCTYPEPCRYPDCRIMSISGTGIDISEYLKSQGIDFKFEKDAMTLYGMVLFN